MRQRKWKKLKEKLEKLTFAQRCTLQEELWRC